MNSIKTWFVLLPLVAALVNCGLLKPDYEDDGGYCPALDFADTLDMQWWGCWIRRWETRPHACAGTCEVEVTRYRYTCASTWYDAEDNMEKLYPDATSIKCEKIDAPPDPRNTPGIPDRGSLPSPVPTGTGDYLRLPPGGGEA